MSTRKRKILDNKTKDAVAALISLSQETPSHAQKTPEEIVSQELNILRQSPIFRKKQEDLERIRNAEAEAQAIRNAERVVNHRLDSVRQGYFAQERNSLASDLIRQLKDAAELKTIRDIEQNYNEDDVRSTNSASNSVLDSVVAPRANMSTNDHIKQLNAASRLRKRYKHNNQWYEVSSDDGDPDPGNRASMPAWLLANVKRHESRNTGGKTKRKKRRQLKTKVKKLKKLTKKRKH